MIKLVNIIKEIKIQGSLFDSDKPFLLQINNEKELIRVGKELEKKGYKSIVKQDIPDFIKYTIEYIQKNGYDLTRTDLAKDIYKYPIYLTLNFPNYDFKSVGWISKDSYQKYQDKINNNFIEEPEEDDDLDEIKIQGRITPEIVIELYPKIFTNLIVEKKFDIWYNLLKKTASIKYISLGKSDAMNPNFINYIISCLNPKELKQFYKELQQLNGK